MGSVDVWGVVSVGVVVLAVAVGLPVLALGGGRLRRRGRGRRRDRVRVGPSLPAVLVMAAARRADTLLLAAVSALFLVAVALNAAA